MNPHDPIEEFFARERGAITSMPGDEQRWESIVAQANRSRRSGPPRWMGYAAGLVAAATVAGLGGWMLRGTGTDGDLQGVDPASTGLPSISTSAGSPPPTSPTADPTAAATQASSATSDTPSVSVPPASSTTPPASPSDTASETTPNKPQPMPATFDTLSVSQAGASTVFALGSGMCTDTRCPVVVRSVDNGGSWEMVTTITDDGTGTTPAVADSMDPVPSAGSFGDIRMANEQFGWIYGGGILQTTDGGLTFHKYPVKGKTVLEVATDGTNVAVASTDGDCEGDRCSGDTWVQVMPVEALAATSEPVRISESDITGVELTWWQGRAYATPVLADGGGIPVAITPGGAAGALTGVCDEGQRGRIAAPGAGSTLFAACESEPTEGQRYYIIRRSNDEGATWTTQSGEGLLVPQASFVNFAAGDDQHLVVATGGDTTEPVVRSSADGGMTWQPVTEVSAGEHGWRWAGAPGASWYYLLPVDPARGFTKATGFGANWSQVGMG